MNICIPVESDRGLESRVSAHFGSAPAFMIVDTRTDRCRVIANHAERHVHGACTPVEALLGERVAGAVVGGIGMGALQRLNAADILVYLSEHATVAETLAAWKAGALKLVEPHMACGRHGHRHG